MFSVIQWFIFLLANAVAIPIVIGSIFHMDAMSIMLLMQRTFFIIGIACFLQGWLGHKLPIVDGPAGLWVSTFAVFAASVGTAGSTGVEALRLLEMAMILTGIILILFGVFKISGKVIRYFTPLVTGVFLTLLTFQLSGTFLQGMFGLSENVQQAQMDGFLIAIMTFLSVLIFSLFFKGWVRSYAVLLGMALGWVLFAVFISPSDNQIESSAWFALPEWFAWGTPLFDWSVVPVAVLTAFILLSNIVASLSAMTETLEGKSNFTTTQMNRGSFMLGVNHGISGIFSGVAVVPLASTSGFLQLTGDKRKSPFMWASLLLMLVAFFPPIISFLAQIPSPVANAALLATFVQLMGLGLRNLFADGLNERRLTIITVSLLLGSGLMFMPAESFSGLPGTARQVISNGLLVGTVIAVILEQLWKKEDRMTE
ncbi:purine/pyrimidine permease [Tenuibacillus multivorans]|uniref:Xanthine/uracil permease n=1 Tax=Tenuibacillus multivorans TaxID=237069 RepID=A0A1G9W473_9BACI|nr:purine/pyrimidine permease [Tenuibacillus multivorans]GEL78748.1 xanthine permease [Tenuibacillus multivorans]SDM78855.1 Xanthine/uracil permease [Tenuibacillus multivorans]